jgi:hypothetical protein
VTGLVVLVGFVVVLLGVVVVGRLVVPVPGAPTREGPVGAVPPPLACPNTACANPPATTKITAGQFFGSGIPTSVVVIMAYVRQPVCKLNVPPAAAVFEAAATRRALEVEHRSQYRGNLYEFFMRMPTGVWFNGK